MPVSWKLLKHLPGGYVSGMWLMQDGSVLANIYGETQLVALRPDAKGSYADGLWTSVGNFLKPKTFYASAVLSDGRLITCGGEYTGANAVSEAHQDESNFCETYDFFKDSVVASVQVSSPFSAIGAWPKIGDAPSVVLDDGTFMLGNQIPGLNAQCALLDPATGTWKVGGGDQYQENTWTLLQTGDVITWSCVDRTNKRFNVTENAFTQEHQDLPVLLGSGASDPETGPGITMMDGRVICFGATGHTCIYTPGAQGQDGSWIQGPDLPKGPVYGDQLHCGDVGATLEPNGNVLVLTQGAKKQTLSAFVEYIPAPNSIGSFGPVLGGAPAVSGCNLTRMLLLPDGHGLIFVASSGDCYDLTFSTGGNPSWAPKITSFPATVEVNTTVPLSGTQLCGLSECQSFGDDNQQAQNYPMVRFVDGDDNVWYARAHDVSTRSIAPGKLGTVQVDIPSLAAGMYSVSVVAMGIPSVPVSVNVQWPKPTITHAPPATGIGIKKPGALVEPGTKNSL